MRRAILSDIHGNLEALQAVLADAREQQVTEIYCLGEVTVFGPDPIACIDLARSFDLNLRGYLDEWVFREKAVIDSVFASSTSARTSLPWTRRQIEDGESDASSSRRAWLLQLPALHREGERLFLHATPSDPINEHLYPEDGKRIALSFRCMKRHQYCFQGHTHLPGIFLESGQYLTPSECDDEFPLPTGKMMCNVGSVGQPRDGDPRAGYAILTDKSIIFRRVMYAIERTIEKISVDSGAIRCDHHAATHL